MDKYALLVVSADEENCNNIRVIGPFLNSENAVNCGMDLNVQCLFKKMEQPEGDTILSIGEVSDFLQAVSRKAVELYRSDPTIDEFVSLEDALLYIAGSLDEPLVREHMLGIIKAGV